MARVMGPDEVSKLGNTGRGRPPKYNWAKWTDGRWWNLTQGTPEEVAEGKADFSVDQESFRVNAAEIAKPRGLKFHGRKIDATHLAIQFVPVEQPTETDGQVA
jgi:hypothetical protein